MNIAYSDKKTVIYKLILPGLGANMYVILAHDEQGNVAERKESVAEREKSVAEQEKSVVEQEESVGNKRTAIIIDPSQSEEVVDLLRRSGITKLIILPTHEHYDHISGINYYRKCFAGDVEVTVICNSACAENMTRPEKNMAMYWEVLISGKSESEQLAGEKVKDLNYSCNADVSFDGDYCFEWQGNKVEIKSAPGHSQGGSIIYLGEKIVFTGDNLTNGNGVICRWPGGSKKDYLEKTKPMIEAIGSDVLICPGHGDEGYISELIQYTEMFKRKAD